MSKPNPYALYNAAMRLGNIYRFASLKLDKPYNGAEHSFRVAVLSMCIADQYNSNHPTKQINIEEVLRKALLHDIEESLMGGDLPTPIKNRSAQFKAEYLKLGTELMAETVKHSPMPEQYLKLWKEDKSGESGEVIRVADWLEALSSAHYEIIRGNLSMKMAYYNLREMGQSKILQSLLEKYPYARDFYNEKKSVPQSIQTLLDEIDSQDF